MLRLPLNSPGTGHAVEPGNLAVAGNLLIGCVAWLASVRSSASNWGPLSQKFGDSIAQVIVFGPELTS
jgi:hypothetical protein